MQLDRSPSFVHGGQLAPKFAHILVFISWEQRNIHKTTLYLEYKMSIERHRKKKQLLLILYTVSIVGLQFELLPRPLLPPCLDFCMPSISVRGHHCHHHCFCFACCCMSNPASLASSAESGFASSPRLSCTASAISATGHKWEGKNYLSVPTLLKINQAKYCITTYTYTIFVLYIFSPHL